MTSSTSVRRAAGFSLLELLVALVVVSLGMGSVLYSQARGMQALNANSWRAQAAVLSEHVIERARANPRAAYTIDYTETRTCSATAVADCDLRAWKQQLARTLPQGDGRIAVSRVTDPVTNREFELIDVTVRWDDQRSGASDESGTQLRHLRIQAFRGTP